MIKRSFMAAGSIFCAVHACANVVSSTDCIFSNVDFSYSTNITINLCSAISVHQAQGMFPKDSGNDVIAPVHVKHRNSSLAQAITVVLFIPGIILLLFSGFTKSAK